jgi:integrase/recombinase XerD
VRQAGRRACSHWISTQEVLLSVDFVVHPVRWERCPLVAADLHACSWLTLQSRRGLAPNTLDAYSRALERLLELNRPRAVSLVEIEQGSQLWCKDTEYHITRKVGPSSGDSFHYTALKWLRFSQMMVLATTHAGPVETIVEDFVLFMKEARRMSSQSIRPYRSRIFHFLKWALCRHERVAMISLQDVDEFLEMKRGEGCLPRTIRSFCTVFRLFFRYAETRGWADFRIARGIRGPRVARYDPLARGLPWRDVRRLLESEVSLTAADLRASAILFLCSIYGLRSSEVVNLTLDDFDWISETFTIRRAKRERVQRYPIQFEVGEAILRYLKLGRPRSTCRNLFLSLQPPYRPVLSATLWTIINKRVKRLEIDLKAFGPHSLRHACATELLRKGSSLKDIADFLGHRNLHSVTIYAKQDVRNLRKVAAFSLAGVK